MDEEKKALREKALETALAQIEREFNSGSKKITYPRVTPKFINDVKTLLDTAGELLISKQRDYGPYNISRAPGGPLNGLRVRIFDKVSRINNLIDTGVEPEHESLRDSFIDLANYAIIAMMVIDGNWPQMDNK
jgi:hypothetical protein